MLYIRTDPRPSRPADSRAQPWAQHTLQLDVERAVGGAHVAHSDQQHVDERPYAQAPEAEELAEALPPLAQVEAICSKAAEGDTATAR